MPILFFGAKSGRSAGRRRETGRTVRSTLLKEARVVVGRAARCVLTELKSPATNCRSMVGKVDCEKNSMSQYEYDVAVIGGGSGGLACAKKCAQLGKKVVLFDFVKLTPQGTKWGLGGTCVNVGCIPKKLMHYAGLLGETISDARSLGWTTLGGKDTKHDWETLVSSVQDYVRSINFGYKVELREKSVSA